MTTLHFGKAEIRNAAVGKDGSMTIELTDQGERNLVEAASRHQAVVDSKAARRQAHLRSLSNEQLVTLAQSRFGGPEPDVLVEASRRVRLVCERLRPAIAAAQSAGLFAHA